MSNPQKPRWAKELKDRDRQKLWNDVVRSMPPPKIADLYEIMTSSYLGFFRFCRTYSLYDLYSNEYIQSLAKYLKQNWANKKIIEVVGGDGRLTSYLKWAGISMLPPTDSKDGAECDFHEEFYGKEVIKMDAIKAIAHFKPDLVIGAWFPNGSGLPEQILKKGTSLIFIGEGHGGCCGTDALWEWPNEELACSQWSLCRGDYDSSSHSHTVLFWPKGRRNA